MGSKNDGMSVMLIGGLLLFAILICALIGGAIWLYGRQSARRVKERQGVK